MNIPTDTLREVVESLEPFARDAARIAPGWSSDRDLYSLPQRVLLKVADFRRAAATLAKLKALLAPPQDASAGKTIPEDRPDFTVHMAYREDGGLRVWSDTHWGLILAGKDPDKVAAAIWPALKALNEYNAAAPSPPASTPSPSKADDTWKPDWTKPIAFANGDPCELIETIEKGSCQFPEATRIVRRIGVDVPEAAIWFMSEDGRTGWDRAAGMFIVNAPVPSPSQQEGPHMTEDQIKHMVDRFLGWRLPEDFHPDCGIEFDAEAARKLNPINHRYEPVGTNLFTATQATAMVRYLIEGLPAPKETDQ